MDVISRLYIGLSFVMLGCLAFNIHQHDSLLDKFKESFVKNVKYPTSLIDRCVATSTVLRIDVDSKKQVKKIYFSDSADSTFNQHLKDNLSNIDLASLSLYLEREQIKSTIVLIPIKVRLETKNCGIITSEDQNPGVNLYNFKSIRNKPNTTLSPILYKYKVALSH